VRVLHARANVALAAALRETRDRERARTALARNLCRCGTYANIKRAIEDLCRA